MATFAVISEENSVINLIIADSKQIAEQVTGLTCVEYTEDAPAYIGGDYVNGYLYGLQPFSSWTRDGKGSWVAPINKPDSTNSYVWDEPTLSWVKVDPVSEI